jgi:hypothetical protein
MRIEITLRSGSKAILDRERMTFTTGDTIKSVFPLLFWPIIEQDGTEVCNNSAVVSWRELPNEQPNVSELSVLPSAVIPSSKGSDSQNHDDKALPMSGPASVPDSGTDWIK